VPQSQGGVLNDSYALYSWEVFDQYLYPPTKVLSLISLKRFIPHLFKMIYSGALPTQSQL